MCTTEQVGACVSLTCTPNPTAILHTPSATHPCRGPCGKLQCEPTLRDATLPENTITPACSLLGCLWCLAHTRGAHLVYQQGGQDHACRPVECLLFDAIFILKEQKTWCQTPACNPKPGLSEPAARQPKFIFAFCIYIAVLVLHFDSPHPPTSAGRAAPAIH